MEYKLSHSELSNIISWTAKEASKQTIYELGLAKIIFTRAEVEKLYGAAIFRKSQDYVKWQKKGDGRTCTVLCLKEDFENYLRKFDIEIKPITQ